MPVLNLIANPASRRKTSRKTAGKKRRTRSAAQRAATRRMLAANRSGRAVHRNPSRRRARRVRRNPSSRGRRTFSAIRSSSITALLKGGAIAGAGGVLNDILYAQLGRVLPASMMAPQDAAGGTNWSYFAGKVGSAVLLGIVGKKVPGMRAHAARLAEGAIAITAYQIMRGMVPASLGLGGMGYYNPAPVMQARRIAGMGAYANVRQIAPASGSAGGAGSRAAMIANAVNAR